MRAKKKKKVWRCCDKKYRVYGRYLRHRRRRHPKEVAKAKHSAQMNNYGQSAQEFEATLKSQGNCCAVCLKPAKNVSLSQDHTHFIAKLKVSVTKQGDRWFAYNEDYDFSYRSRSRKKAKRMIVQKLKRESRRGILCWHCNSALRKFLDNYKLLIAAGKYLKEWSRKQSWDYVRDKNGERHRLK